MKDELVYQELPVHSADQEGLEHLVLVAHLVILVHLATLAALV